ncbi:MAG: substrate-binding domain-containing protein [Lachnospiraceae bacterium]|nr:substrate-binding domain-containing protein [Lachnospiraceae bacterium]
MKKYFLLVFILAGILCSVSACKNSQVKQDNSKSSQTLSENQKSDILIISREEGSGTRDTFVQITGVLQKDTEGRYIDRTASQAIIANDPKEVIQKVADDKKAIGYLSLGEYLQYSGDDIKGMKVDNIKATKEAVKAEDYKLSRPFILAYRDDLNDLQADFLRYITGKGQNIVDEVYVAVKKPTSFLSLKPEGTLIVNGSTSVAPLMKALAEGYEKENPKAKIKINISDSTNGLTCAMQKKCDFAMSSRQLKDYEKEMLNEKIIAKDGIAIIVNKDNDITNCSMEQLQKIFTGEIKSYDAVK